MDWQATIKQIAPTVATALLGPMGGAAVAAIGAALNIDDATPDKLQSAIAAGQVTPEQLGQLKALEMQYQADEAERGFKYAELVFKDTADARAREVATKDNTNRILAYIVLGSFVAMVAVTLLGLAKVESVLAGTLVGYLSAKAEQVLSYYFGSSSGSRLKTELMVSQK